MSVAAQQQREKAIIEAENNKLATQNISRNSAGEPLLPDGTIDIERLKREMDEKYLLNNPENIQHSVKKFRNPMTHLTPKKKKRKK